jgi:hypothetical protein
MDKLKTGSGKRLRAEALTEVALPVPYDAAAMPGATVLGTDGRVYISTRTAPSSAYEWSVGARELDGVFYLGPGVSGAGPSSGFGSTTSYARLQVENVGLETQGAPFNISAAFIRHASSEVSSAIAICKSRGTAPGSRTIVQNGDRLGSLLFQGADGAGFFTGCSLRGVVDTAPALGNISASFDFSARAGGVDSLAARLTSAGNLLIGNTTGTERLSVTGKIQLTATGDSYMVGTNNVVGSRKTGWAAPTGTATRTTFATSTVTTEQLAERVKALIDDLTSHGLVGA